MKTESKNITLKVTLIIMTIGVWVIALQNLGIIEAKKYVYIKGGYVNTEIDGTVKVEVDNLVDVNVSEVNGHSNAFYGPSKNGNYDAIRVYTGD